MSLICLCVTNVEKQEEQMHYQNRLIEIAKYHERGIKFAVNWSEPVLENIKGNKMIVNLLDETGKTIADGIVKTSNISNYTTIIVSFIADNEKINSTKFFLNLSNGTGCICPIVPTMRFSVFLK